MSSYLSNLLTHTTSKYNTLRRTLLSSEDDGDTEDDTHICRVLRAYYTEKGRPFPQWLPADPNERRQPMPQMYTQASSYFSSATSKTPYTSVQNSAGNRSSLNDLWDAPAAGQANNTPVQPQSLRNARRPVAPPQGSSASLAPQARPLPSQRAGSYQTVSSQAPSTRPGSGVDPSPPPSSAGGGSAQERLKARLWGGRSASPVPGQSPGQPSGQYGGQNQIQNQNPYDQPRTGSANPYDQPRTGGGNPYDQPRTGGGNPYDSGPRRYGR